MTPSSEPRESTREPWEAMWFARGWDAALAEVEEGSDTMTREPETEAGRTLLNRRTDDISMFEHEWRDTVLAIETEAWNAALAAVEEAVGGLDNDSPDTVQARGWARHRSAVLSRLAALRKGASE